MNEDSAVATVFAVLLACAAGVVAWSLSLRFRRRELQHREWMAALEKGLPLPEVNALETGAAAPRIYLLRGLVWLACGVTLTLFLGALWLTSEGRRPSLDAQVRQAQQLQELGYSEVEIRSFIQPRIAMGPGFPAGLCVIGLVPAGIGVAYLTFYRLEMRRSGKSA